MKRIILLLLCLVSLNGCKPDLWQSCSASHAYYHFSYENHAWVSIHSGWMIDENGTVRAYKNPAKWNYPDSLGYISRDQLEENLSYCDSVIGKVSTREMSYYNHLVFPASKGSLTRPEQHGADMGIQMYSCYWHDRTEHRYRQVILNQYGDWIRTNDNDKAVKIYKWLRKLVAN
ncbi:MAG TPA: hypothetical protein DDW70_02820 [Rikenellaceae bacterium]|jgi:hypothetical protein|nr:hypothetical protein [Bacteroidales bacterium]HBG53134.1 hypothetical protein [Rikenellaceae bacterium]